MEITQPNVVDPNKLIIEPDGTGLLIAGHGKRFAGGGTTFSMGPMLTDRYRAAYQSGQSEPENAPVSWDAKKGYVELVSA